MNDGLVFSFLLDGRGGGTAVSWEDMETWTPEQGTLWVHLDYASETVQEWLRERSGLDPITAEALLEEETRPRAVLSGEGLLLILRGVNCNPGSDPEDMVSLRLWVDEHRIISMRHRRVWAVDDIRKAVASRRGPASSSDFVALIAERLTDRMGEVISELDDVVDELEDEVVTSESRELRSRLADVRRRAITLRRYIAPQREVLSRLSLERIPWVSDRDRLRLRETADRTTRYIEDMDSARDRAAVTHEELSSRLAEQMNRTMYLLSLVAAVFLPLGFITGLLGINVAGIPGSEYQWAFVLVCIVLVVIILVEYWLFRRKKWL